MTMTLFLDFLAMKSKGESTQRSIISDISDALEDTDVKELREILAKDAPTLAEKSDKEMIIIWSLIFYISDIGTVPLASSREEYLSDFRALCSSYSLSADQILRLSYHGDFALNWFRSRLA